MQMQPQSSQGNSLPFLHVEEEDLGHSKTLLLRLFPWKLLNYSGSLSLSTFLFVFYL
jgi:hypothetical protein